MSPILVYLIGGKVVGKKSSDLFSLKNFLIFLQMTKKIFQVLNPKKKPPIFRKFFPAIRRLLTTQSRSSLALVTQRRSRQLTVVRNHSRLLRQPLSGPSESPVSAASLSLALHEFVRRSGISPKRPSPRQRKSKQKAPSLPEKVAAPYFHYAGYSEKGVGIRPPLSCLSTFFFRTNLVSTKF